MDLITLVVGLGIGIATIAGFFYMLLLQDRHIDKMRDNGDGSLRV